MMFARETYDQVVADIARLLPAHHAELAMFKDDIPLDPNWFAYSRSAKMDLIRIYTARAEDDQVIGYAVFQVLERHAHYAHRWAVNDVLWIAPEHRNIGVGGALFDCFEADLRDGGPIVIVIETKAHAPALAALCQARGYGLIGPVFGKRIA